MSADRHIENTLAKYGEPWAGNIWRVQGQAVIYHRALERIATKAGVRFERPQILRAEAEEAVLLVVGSLDGREEWSIGEAKIGTNYRVSGRQAAYVWAMAEKRAKDRVILKLIELHGVVYAEDEADDFREELKRQRAQERLSKRQNKPAPARTVYDPETGGQVEAKPANVTPLKREEDDDFPGEDAIIRNIAEALRAKINQAPSTNAVTDLMLSQDTQRSLADLPQADRDSLRDFAKARLVALGWPSKKAS